MIFVSCTVNSCDFIVHVVKKKKKAQNAETETHNPNRYLIHLLLIFLEYSLPVLTTFISDFKVVFRRYKKKVYYCGGVKPRPMIWAQEQRFINNTPEEKKS